MPDSHSLFKELLWPRRCLSQTIRRTNQWLEYLRIEEKLVGCVSIGEEIALFDEFVKTVKGKLNYIIKSSDLLWWWGGGSTSGGW